MRAAASSAFVRARASSASSCARISSAVWRRSSSSAITAIGAAVTSGSRAAGGSDFFSLRPESVRLHSNGEDHADSPLPSADGSSAAGAGAAAPAPPFLAAAPRFFEGPAGAEGAEVMTFISAARAMNTLTSSAKADGSQPGICSTTFFRRSFPSSPLCAAGMSPSSDDDASWGMVWVWTCSAPSTVRRCAMISASSRGESSAVSRMTSGTFAFTAATAASRESTTIRSA
jgi:hypothetical protein